MNFNSESLSVVLSVALESAQKAQCLGEEDLREGVRREEKTGERIETRTLEPFMSASKDQVKFLQLTPGSFLWPGSMPNTAAAELGPRVP